MKDSCFILARDLKESMRASFFYERGMVKFMKRALTKYIISYSEPEIVLCEKLFKGEQFDCALTVPACDEFEFFPYFWAGLKRAAKQADKKILFIIVLNRNKSMGSLVAQNNQNLLNYFVKVLGSERESWDNHFYLIGREDKVSYLLIDRTSEGLEFESDKGVGLARKIACDLACGFYAKKILRLNHIYTTDCDALLPPDFFEMPSDLPEKFLMIAPYRHTFDKNCSDLQIKSMEAYEGYLRYYVEGLKRAGSPYAFPTIGSLLSFSAEAYACVRGFSRKKMAGEDFYFQNKVLKVASCFERSIEPILLSCRLSERVPFGTGQSVRKIIQLLEENKSFLVEDPKVFDVLGLYLDCSYSVLLNKSIFFRELEQNKRGFEAKEFQQLINFFEKNISFLQIIEKTKGSSFLQKKKNFHDGFDAFKTLKFIHTVTDQIYPKVPWIFDSHKINLV